MSAINSKFLHNHWEMKKQNALQATSSLAQAGVLSRGTPRRILEVYLPSEPYRYPRLPQAAKTLGASGGHYSGVIKGGFCVS